MTEAELRLKMYWICCPVCDNDKCHKGTPQCEAEQWLEKKLKEGAMGLTISGEYQGIE